MACCECCCGQRTCDEGDEGKCCCGGTEGTCCDEGQYCCNGVCENAPCGCECADVCAFSVTTEAETATASVPPAGTGCTGCGEQSDTDSVPNPDRPGDQVGLGDNELSVYANLDPPASLSGGIEDQERYLVTDPDDGQSVEERNKYTSYSALAACDDSSGVAVWTVTGTYFYSDALYTRVPGVSARLQLTTRVCEVDVAVNDACLPPCEIEIGLSPSGMTVNGVLTPWTCSTDTATCQDYDGTGQPSGTCTDYLDEPHAGGTVTIACRAGCDCDCEEEAPPP